MPTYSLSQQMRANSPQTGRATGMRHRGGGTIHGGGGKSSGGKKSGGRGSVLDDPAAGYTQGPSGGLNIQGINPSPGAMFRPGAAQMQQVQPQVQTQDGSAKSGGGAQVQTQDGSAKSGGGGSKGGGKGK